MCKKNEELIGDKKNMNESKHLDDLRIDLNVMQKNISSSADKMPLKIKFRRIGGFFRRLIRSALIIQESFNAATYRVIKQLTQRVEELEDNSDKESSIKDKIQKLEKKVEDLSDRNRQLEEEVKQFKAIKDKSDDK